MTARIITTYDDKLFVLGTWPNVYVGSAQTSPQEPILSDALLNKIPADLRDAAKEHIRMPLDRQQMWLAMSEEDLRQNVMLSLSFIKEAADFVLEQLPKEPSANARSGVIRNLAYNVGLSSRPAARAVVKQIIATDSSVEVVNLAIDALRDIEMKEIRSLVSARLQKEQAGGNTRMTEALVEQEERWISLEKGVMLPGFMRSVPPVFSLKPAGRPIRVAAVGDYGFGNGSQKHVGNAMIAAHKTRPFDFGITLGDNFYGEGMFSPDDPRWQVWWEDVYSPIGIKFYVAFGNHDWYWTDSPAAEILYSRKSPSWHMPAPYYSYTAGDVQFFVIDSNDMSAAQLAWLKRGLEASRSRWKIVYGHHPIYFAMEEGRPPYDKRMLDMLMPVLAGRADAYLAGHYHSMQHIKPENGVHFFVSAGGGASLYPVFENSQRAYYAKSINGFAAISADRNHFKVDFIGAHGESLYEYTLEKAG